MLKAQFEPWFTIVSTRPPQGRNAVPSFAILRPLASPLVNFALSIVSTLGVKNFVPSPFSPASRCACARAKSDSSTPVIPSRFRFPMALHGVLWLPTIRRMSERTLVSKRVMRSLRRLRDASRLRRSRGNSFFVTGFRPSRSFRRLFRTLRCLLVSSLRREISSTNFSRKATRFSCRTSFERRSLIR